MYTSSACISICIIINYCNFNIVLVAILFTLLLLLIVALFPSNNDIFLFISIHDMAL